MLAEAFSKLTDKKDLTSEEAVAAMREIMSGGVSDSLLAGFLVALRAKGETAEEIAAFARVLREQGTRIRTRRVNVVDTCGTGGDGKGTFNVSTAAAIIAAGAGVAVAKHGNRAVSSSCGSADVLEALGLRLDLSPEKVGTILDEIGITFLFAPQMHSAMRHAAKVRKELGIRTVFNILGPLANPANAKRQLLGVYRADIGQRMAEALRDLGSEHALIVHGEGGVDEVTATGKTLAWELLEGKIRHFTIENVGLGLSQHKNSDIRGSDPQTNAAIIRSILDGKPGAPREIALLNAASAILVSGKTPSMSEGVKMATDSVDSGRASTKLKDWIAASKS